MEITKRWLQSKSACEEGIDWVVKNCKNKKEVDVIKALMSDNKLDWANWLIVRVMDRPQYLTYAIYAAEQVVDIFEKKYPKDKWPRKAIEAAKAVLKNDTSENRAAAYAAAYAAADAAYAAAYAAADAAYTVADAAYAAAYAAAYTVADAAYTVADAAYAAAYTVADAAYAAADAAMKKKILVYGLKLLEDSDEAKAE